MSRKKADFGPPFSFYLIPVSIPMSTRVVSFAFTVTCPTDNGRGCTGRINAWPT